MRCGQLVLVEDLAVRGRRRSIGKDYLPPSNHYLGRSSTLATPGSDADKPLSRIFRFLVHGLQSRISMAISTTHAHRAR